MPDTSRDRETPRGRERIVEEETIPLVEERVHIDKRVVEGRTVTVQTRPVSETVTLSEPVTRETIEIERKPIGKVVEAAPEIQETEELTIIPVVEERVQGDQGTGARGRNLLAPHPADGRRND